MASKSDLFARLALDYADHPKIAALSDAAFRAHIELILYARKYETDGIIRNPIANRLAFRWDTDVLTELQNNDDEAPSLIRLESGDYYLHGYEDMQETKAEIEQRRRKNRGNGRKGGRPPKAKKPTGLPTGLPNKNPTANPNETQTKAETETETETEVTPLSSDVASDDHDGGNPAPEFSEDVHQLCDHLANHIRHNGNKVGKVGVTWWKAMDRLLRIDGYTPAQVRQVIDWSQQDEFWQGNILSAPKLREKFDQLKTRMLNERNKPQGNTGPQTASERRLAAGAERLQRKLGDRLAEPMEGRLIE